jgi:lysozyme
VSSFWDRCKTLYANKGVPPANCAVIGPVIAPAELPVRAKAGAGLGALIAAACLVAAPLTQRWEGYRARVYNDPAHIKSYCYGETTNVNPMAVYTKGQCGDLLRARMAKDYAPQVARCLPTITSNRFAFGALIDASYNTGWYPVCNGFAGWYTTARDRRSGRIVQLKGLVNRRLDERATCLRGVA